jgi:S-adenosylmethionine-dependent methyltransferase
MTEPDATTGEQRVRIREALLRTLYRNRDPRSFENDAWLARELDEHAFVKHDRMARHLVPWLKRFADLSRAEIAEIGCGTGSVLAALAPHAERIAGFDTDQPSIEGARARLDVLGIDNATASLVRAEDQFETIGERLPEGVHMVLLFAVLEHMTVAERLHALARSWNLLRPGGLLVVGGVPNRLTYFDYHTSLLPFFHMLPPELCAEYCDRSPRTDIISQWKKARARGGFETVEYVIRAGTSVSYHEFEVALGARVHEWIVADGFEEEIMSWVAPTPDEKLLQAYVDGQGIPIHRAFTRKTLNLILEKPCDTDLREGPARADQKRRNRGWTAKRRAAIVLRILKGDITAKEAAEESGLNVEEIQRWVHRGLRGLEYELRSEPS